MLLNLHQKQMKESETQFQNGIKSLRNGDYEKALHSFNQLISENPKNANYYSERGVVYFHIKQKKDAIVDMNKAIELEPNNSYRYSSRAYILGHYGKTKEAILDYEKAIELDPEDAIAYNNLGLLQEQLGHIQKAKGNFSLADELAKDMPKVGRTDLNIEGEEIQTRNIQKEIDQENKDKTIYSELKGILSKEGRASFGRFIKSGFKKT
jgi:Flp pilus assembly protein TadD